MMPVVNPCSVKSGWGSVSLAFCSLIISRLFGPSGSRLKPAEAGCDTAVVVPDDSGRESAPTQAVAGSRAGAIPRADLRLRDPWPASKLRPCLRDSDVVRNAVVGAAPTEHERRPTSRRAIDGRSRPVRPLRTPHAECDEPNRAQFRDWSPQGGPYECRRQRPMS